jgi:ferredoxin
MSNHAETTAKIREAAKRALADGRADVVIGYRAGTFPLVTAPLFARTQEDCDQLIWNDFACLNLANYLPGRPGKVAIVAKGCDARSAIGQVTENQILRENLYVIGVPCSGMIDWEALLEKEPRPAREISSSGATVTVTGDGFATDLKKDDVLRRNCLVCANRTPKEADELLGAEEPGAQPDDFADIKALLAKSPAERLDYVKGLIKDCLRCYACRNACPLCYCPVCFVDETRPQWLGKSKDPMDTLVFHILRGLHCAGRCTSCGACESACPVSIKVREFNRLNEETVRTQWGYEAGLSWDQKPPLSVFLPDDEAGFIK